jgi:ribosomal protein S18 acetylase RimI-like enzyme
MIQEYFKETQNLDYFEDDYGFIFYKIQDTNLHIQHMYIKPEARAMKAGTMMADKLVALAKEAGCITMTGDVELNNLKVTDSLKFILHYGLEIVDIMEDEILLGKYL